MYSLEDEFVVITLCSLSLIAPAYRFVCGQPGGGFERRRAADWKLFRDHESAALKMPDDALRGNIGRESVAVVNAFFAREAQRERNRTCDVRWIGGSELLVIAHGRNITGGQERSKNEKLRAPSRS